MLGLAAKPEDDDGQAIRSQNYAAGAKAAASAKQSIVSAEPTACLLLTNMFDPKFVDLNKDPEFFIDIKDHVYSTCQNWGRVEKILIDEDSAGFVWVKFSGQRAVEAASEAVKTLD